MKKLILFFIFVLLLTSVVVAQTNSIGILTVSEIENGTLEGGVASLELLIQEGSGSIFIESFPLSNVDTQAVTRIATDIACSYSERDCSNLDFFYTIRTNSGFVRGPSAGGATALLALATLEGVTLDGVAMTGGISSGGLITSVGGVKEKALAAIEEDYEVILIPKIALNVTLDLLNTTTETNNSFYEPLLLEEFQSENNEVQPVISLNEAYYLATGIALPVQTILEPPAYYTQRMKETSSALCARTNDLFASVEERNISITNRSLDFYNRSLDAQSQGDYYSAASFCYSANLRLREQIVSTLSETLLQENYDRLQESIFSFDEQIESYRLETFSDLEAYIIVKERLFEAQEYLDEINTTNISANLLSLGIERYYSAVAWSGFFGIPGESLVIDNDSLELACIEEIKETESRSNYLKTTLPTILIDDILSGLDDAYEQYNQENYALCIFRASKAKANAHMFMNEILVDEQVEEVFAVKRMRTEELIAQQQREGIFPIIGYSYYEYSAQLVEDQPYLSLLFSEYALAMADVNKYFPKKQTVFVVQPVSLEIFYLIIGILVGVILTKMSAEKKTVGEIRLVKGPVKKHTKKPLKNATKIRSKK